MSTHHGRQVHIKQAVNLTAIGAAQGGSLGALWGTLVGLLLLNSLAGMALGALAGARPGALPGITDFGINDEFIKKLGETIPAGSSALFIQVKEMTEHKFFPRSNPSSPACSRRPCLTPTKRN